MGGDDVEALFEPLLQLDRHDGIHAEIEEASVIGEAIGREFGDGVDCGAFEWQPGGGAVFRLR